MRACQGRVSIFQKSRWCNAVYWWCLRRGQRYCFVNNSRRQQVAFPCSVNSRALSFRASSAPINSCGSAPRVSQSDVSELLASSVPEPCAVLDHESSDFHHTTTKWRHTHNPRLLLHRPDSSSTPHKSSKVSITPPRSKQHGHRC
jgi:hypothetical protein